MEFLEMRLSVLATCAFWARSQGLHHLANLITLKFMSLVSHVTSIYTAALLDDVANNLDTTHITLTRDPATA